VSLDLLQTLVVQVSQARGFEAALQCVIEQVCHATALLACCSMIHCLSDLDC
jgi:hypothetical protein